jgi:hypothetical protein
MVKRISASCIFLAFISCFCNCQKGFLPGYVISNDFDTIYGFIDMKSNYHNSMFCEFRQEENSEPKTYNPGEIRGYRIENTKFYVSRKITMNGGEKTVFLEYLVNGIVDLYYLKDIATDYYFIEKDGVLNQLTNEEIPVKVGNVSYTRESKKYVGILNILFKDSPQTLTKIPATGFGYNSLISITKDYHNNVCKDQVCIDYTKSTKVKIWLEPYIGIRLSWTTIYGSPAKSYCLRPNGGINIRFIPYRINTAWSINSGLFYVSDSFSKNFITTPGDYPCYTGIKYSMIGIPIALTYTFPGNKVQPFISFGYINSLIINYSGTKKEYQQTGTLSNTYYDQKPFYCGGFSLDAGLKYNLNRSKYIFIRNELKLIFGGCSEIINLGVGFNIN